MNIGIDGRLLDLHHNTGISRYIQFYIGYYCNRYGSENVYIVTNDKTLDYNGCNIVYTHYKPFNMLHFFCYHRFILKQPFDLFHIPFYSGLQQSIPNIKVFVTVHDMMYRLVDGFFGRSKILNNLAIKYFDYIIKTTLKHSNAVISVSHTTQIDLERLWKVSSVRIPEYSEVCSSVYIDILNAYHLKYKHFFFYCGNNRPHKNIEMLVRVFNKSEELYPLVLAGKGHVSSKNVLALGVVTDDVLAALYKSARAFVFLSKYEGFGLPVLESLYSNTLVVASDIPAFQEFKASRNISFFDLSCDSSLLNALIQNQQRLFIDDSAFLNQFTIDSIYRSIDNLISSVCQ